MRWWVLLAGAVALAAGCSLFGDYSLEGLPCDPGAAPGQECLPDAGFVCERVDGGAVCVRAR